MSAERPARLERPSATASATVRLGAYLGVGPDRVDETGPASEYGPLPRVLYASLAWFF